MLVGNDLDPHVLTRSRIIFYSIICEWLSVWHCRCWLHTRHSLTVFASLNSSLNSRYFIIEQRRPRVTDSDLSRLSLTNIILLKDDKKSLADPSEYNEEDDTNQELSDSEGSDTPLCESPPPPAALSAPPLQLYAKSNAVKEQIQCKNGLNVNKKGNKPMSKWGVKLLQLTSYPELSLQKAVQEDHEECQEVRDGVHRDEAGECGRARDVPGLRGAPARDTHQPRLRRPEGAGGARGRDFWGESL